MKKIINILLLITLWSCQTEKQIKPDYFLTADQKHNKFNVIPPVLKVKSGSVIKAMPMRHLTTNSIGMLPWGIL